MPWARTLNTPNWPTGMLPPLQSISDTVDVKDPSSVLIGRARWAVCTFTVQPDPASGVTTTIGCVRGNWTRSPVTLATIDSLGPRKVKIASPVLWGGDAGLSATWRP